jgi:hypothetical protein
LIHLCYGRDIGRSIKHQEALVLKQSLDISPTAVEYTFISHTGTPPVAMAHVWKSAWAKKPHPRAHQNTKPSHTHHHHHGIFPPTDPLAPPATREMPASPEVSTSKRRSIFNPLSLTPHSSIDVTSAELGIEMANMPASPERTPNERPQFPWIPTSPRRRDSEENSLRSELSRRSTEL